MNTDVTKIACDASKLTVSAAIYALMFHKASPVCQSLLVAKSEIAARELSIVLLGAYRCTHTWQALMNHGKEVL